MDKQKTSHDADSDAEMFAFNLIQLASYLFSYRRWIILGAAACFFITLLWVLLIKQEMYRATSTLSVDLLGEERGTSSASESFFYQDQMVINKIGNVEQFFESREFKKFLYETYKSADGMSELKNDLSTIAVALAELKLRREKEVTDWLYDKIDIKGFSEKSRIDVSVSAHSPELASAMANFGSYALVEYNRLILGRRIKRIKMFLNQQTLQTKSELADLEEQLVKLQESARIVSPEDVRMRANSIQVDQVARQIELDRQYTAVNTLITETESDLDYFKKLMKENDQTSHLYIEQIQKRLEVLHFKKLQEAGEPSDSRTPAGSSEAELDDGIKKVVGELTVQLNHLGPVSQTPWEYVKKIEAALYELRIKRAQARSEVLSQQEALKRINHQFSGLPEILKKMSEVKRNIDLSTSLYNSLMARLQETQIKDAAHNNDLVLISSAKPPTVPSGFGRLKTILLAIIGGIIFSCLPLFLRFVLLPTIRTTKDLEHMGVPIMGGLSWRRGSNSFFAFNRNERFPLILNEAPGSPVANTFRYVRFKVGQALQIRPIAPGNPSKVIVVNSVRPKEGRTFVTANLAHLFASTGVRTCILDLDFAKPDVVGFFPDAQPLESAMLGLFPEECGFKIYRVSENLAIFSPKSTHENMSEILETRQFQAALNALEIKFEVIFMDTPPVEDHMQSVIAAQYADGLILVVNQRETLRTEVEDTIRTLQSSLDLPIMGLMNFTFDELPIFRRRARHSWRPEKSRSIA